MAASTRSGRDVDSEAAAASGLLDAAILANGLAPMRDLADSAVKYSPHQRSLGRSSADQR
jgi:hypothetical protein